MPSQKAAPRRVDGLDLLRAAAITFVVADHGALFFYLVYRRAALGTHLGEIGVTLFFALSGFLIGGLLLDAGAALGDLRAAGTFWLRRALRTLPNYYLFIVLNLAYWWAFRPPPGSPSPLPLVPRYLFFLQNLGPAQNWFFPESWSLAVEEWFYLVFPLLLLTGLRLSHRPFRQVYWAATVALLLLPPILRGLFLPPADWSRGITNVLIYRPDSIALGLAAVAWSREHPGAWSRARRPAAGTGLALLIGFWLYVSYGDADRSPVARVLLFPGISLGCALLLPWASACSTLAWPWLARPVRALARWSYSLYLVNLMVSTSVLSHVQYHYGTAAGIAAYLSCSLILSAALYHGFEAPILRWRDRVLPKAPPSGLPLAAAPLGAEP